ncbi:MAG: hypothetical protein OEV08_12270, partial [Nitrospira sp.]|nr:hypothetical protein [Nitrospira sp.]
MWDGRAARRVGPGAGLLHRRSGGQSLRPYCQVGAQADYVLFVLMRYWVPTVLPPPGRERLTKSDPDYWLES